MKDYLTFEDSDWLREMPIWIANLNNGQTVYQHDHAPGCEEPSTWIRLRNYCSDNNILIDNLYLRYWDHVVNIRSGAAGYYYANGVGAWLDSSAPTKRHFIIGVLEGEIIRKSVYSNPELTFLEYKVSDFDPNSLNFWWGTGRVLIEENR